MKIFASMSAAEADQAGRGALRGDFVWVDSPSPGKAGEDSVWVAIDMQDNRMARFERRRDAPHREFLIPARITNLHRAQRVQPPL